MEPLQTGPEQGKRLGLYLRESRVSKKGSTTEVDSQADEGRDWADANGYVIPTYGIYTDNDRSASPYATKVRLDYPRLIRDIKAGRLDYVWFWSLSRSQRELDQYVELRNLCQTYGVNWVIGDRVYDLNDYMDLQALGYDAVSNETHSRKMSKDLLKGFRKQARLKRPHSVTTYGYKREYHPETGDYITQNPQEPQASVVREIITRLADNDDIAKIKRDLEARGTPTPQGGTNWRRSVIRSIATNKAYIGVRVHRPTKVVNKRRIQTGVVNEYPDAWPALIDEETFYRAQNVLAARTSKSVPSPVREAKHLLTYVARGECGEYLAVIYDKRKNGRYRKYRCTCREICSSCPADELDNYVKAMIDGALVTEEWQAAIAARHADDANAVAARAEVTKLKAELAELRTARKAGRLTLDEYIDFRDDTAARLRAAEDRLQSAVVVPAVLTGEVDWDDLAAARKAVAALVDVVIHPVGKGRRGVPIEDRVTIVPRYGRGVH